MQRSDLLIQTKLHVPFIRPDLVSRQRLQAQIAMGLHGPLTLVIAPAGFGKTTLVASAVASFRIPVAWLSLDAEDNQPGRFLKYLVAALQSADGQIGSAATQLMMGMLQAPPEAVLTSLINELEAAAREMVLVLDDYQFARSPSVHAATAFLLEHCPHTLHLLIATRSDPPLPLARLRARGQLVELRATDLRFTDAEATQFLNDVMGLELDTGCVAVLEERTEGWAAGLQMAALSLRDRENMRGLIQGFSGTNRYILDYLLEEILVQQPPEIQRFLLYTSILERLTAPLCDAILYRDDAAAAVSSSQHQSAPVLEYLERENLFLVSLDDDRLWFRYHHLFADLLRNRLHQIQPDLIPSLHLQASSWLEQKGFFTEAIQHLFAAHEMDRAADLIERYGPLRWAESDPSVVQMADSLPHEILISRPKIGFYQAWYFIIQGFIEKAVPLLLDLKQQLANADPASGQHWIRILVALAFSFLGRRSSAPEFDPLPDFGVLDQIPADEIMLRETADILYALTMGRRGDVDRAAEITERCILRQAKHYGAPHIPSLVPFLARIYFLQGRLIEAASLCHEYLDPIKEKGLHFIYSAGAMDIVLGEVLYERNCLEEAEKRIRDGLEANGPWVDIMSDAFGQLALIRVFQAKRDFAGALQLVQKFETKLSGYSGRPHEFEEDFRTLSVRVQLASGDLKTASDWADQIRLNEDFQLNPKRYCITLARIRLAEGRYADAEELLTGTVPPNAAANRITRQIESGLLLAAAMAGQDRLLEALQLIESCLALAEPEGYVQVFLEAAEPVQQLLIAYLRSDMPDKRLYARRILDASSLTHQTSPSVHQPPFLIEPLTGREMEVLYQMSLGCSNQAIARRLVVAQGTVKAHAASIYRKLEVANRTEAVTRARQMDLLP